MSVKPVCNDFSHLLQQRLRLGLMVLLMGALTLSGCSFTPSPVYRPKQPPAFTHNDICKLTRHAPMFYQAAKRAEKRWGTPAHVLLAFVHRESRFVANARSSSGAYGYPQAKNATWREYKKAIRNPNASRENIYDAMDFIGWYNYLSHKRLGISRWDAYRLYLAYHEGRAGYARGSWKRKPHVRQYARQVANLAWRYRKQMKRCGLAG